MSFLTTAYPRSGFSTGLIAPTSGIYYASVAVYNVLTQGFLVQNGVNQNNLAPQQAQLFAVPTSGSSMVLQPLPRNYPYGAFLGPIQAVWFEPDDGTGSYPVTLGALAGLVQWTPLVTLGSDAIYVVPGAPISSVLISAATPGATITVTGVESSTVLGIGVVDASGSVQIPLEEGTIDTVFAVTSSESTPGTVSIFVGVAPVVTQGGGGGGGVTYYASLTGTGEVDTPGDLTQAGGFTVTDSLGHGFTVNSTAGTISLTTTGAGTIALVQDAGALVIDSAAGTIQIGHFPSGTLAIFLYADNETHDLQDSATFNTGTSFNVSATTSISLTATTNLNLETAANALLESTGGGTVTIRSGGTQQIIIDGTADTMTINAGKIGVFGAAPVVAPASGGTLPGVIAGLVALGWFAS